MSLRLQKLESGNWQVVYKDRDDSLRSITADSGKVDDLIKILQDLEAVGFVSDAPSSLDLANFGLDDPQRRIVLRESDGSRYFLQLGQLDSANNLIYASTSLAATVYQVRPFVLAATSLSPLRFRDRRILPLPGAANLLAIEWLARSDEDESMIRRLQGSDLEASPLAARARGFEVGEFLREGFQDPWQRDASSVVEWTSILRFMYRLPGDPADSDPRVEELFLSERRGGTTQFAASRSEDVIFTLPLNFYG
ncbi:MAG: DUF4340 domain-containing protein [Verrucomicrobia bacterium]|nr:DUF4340 domain-containing protein [Verrucomicrobiota bacterium]